VTKRAVDVLAYFDRPGTGNGPTEAINGRLEHLRGSALGFRKLTNYIARSWCRPRDRTLQGCEGVPA
jgi:transposase